MSAYDSATAQQIIIIFLSRCPFLFVFRYRKAMVFMRIRFARVCWSGLRVCGSHSPGAKREPTTRSATLDRQRQEAALFGVRLPGAPRIICEHVAKRTCVVCLCFYVFDPNRSHCWLLAAAVLPLVRVRCLVSAARSIGSSRSGYGNTVHTAECDHGE